MTRRRPEDIYTFSQFLKMFYQYRDFFYSPSRSLDVQLCFHLAMIYVFRYLKITLTLAPALFMVRRLEINSPIVRYRDIASVLSV